MRWEHLATGVDTLVFLMGVANLPHITKQLIANGRPAATPAAVIRWGTEPEQRVLMTTVGTAAEDVAKAQLKPPAIFIVGEVVRLREKLQWFDKLSQSGTYVPVNHPEPRFFPRWMSARFQRFGLKALPDAVNFMCHAYEGNLLAASQEIEKLTLLSPPQPISVAYLQETIIRHAHFTPFQLVDTLLEGKVNRAQRILLALRAEGTEPGMLAWTLCRELEQLTELALAARAGQPLVEHFSRLRIWQSRQQLIQQALTRLPVGKIQQLWQLMARLDDAQRRFDTEQAWLMLQTIALGFRDGTPLPLLEADPC